VSAVVGVVLFPGSNCEHDVIQAVESFGASARICWHQEASLAGVDAVVLPGGFAHGDYLRPGAIARFSPVMGAVARAAADGVPVLGICNGFQVLTEAGLLPGALTRNAGLRFVCATVPCVVASTASVLTSGAHVGDVLELPVNHGEGRYVCDARTLAELRAEGRIVLRYASDVNGSLDQIAGIANASGNVVGLMPHPERASSPLTGSADGRVLLASFLRAAARTGSLLGAPVA